MLQIGDNSKRIKKILLASLLNEACLQCTIFRYFCCKQNIPFPFINETECPYEFD